MKNLYVALLLCFTTVFMNAQTPFQRVYATLNTKCQNSSCHSSTATDASAALRFDGSIDSVYAAIFNVSSTNASSIAKFEKLVKPQQPYSSFLLRKIAGAGFDTDLAIDSATEGALMVDTGGQQLSKKEIEFIRQWIMFGAKETYSTGGLNPDPQPNWQYVSDYYDNPANPFLAKPPKPFAGTGMQLRMGPIFLAASGSQVEQEWLEQQEVNFPYESEIQEIDGFMNQQAHHFLLFRYPDSLSATSPAASNPAPDINDMALVSFTTHTSFDGNKNLVAGWQADNNFVLPDGTGLMWDKHTYLDMNFHTKNYNATSILPCDFYFNIYYKPRNPNTIPMISALENNATLFLPQGIDSVDHDAGNNNNATKETRYIWNIAGHNHKYGKGFDIYLRDSTGQLSQKIYDGTSVTPYGDGYYDNGTYGIWDYEHPAIEYWPNLLPVTFGKQHGHNSGMVARSTWDVLEPFVTFSFQTSGEMELFYYMYTQQPLSTVSSINDPTQKGIYFQVMPNPMNSDGKLVYSLDKPANVEASVVDITGKAIALLNAENEEAGVHSITISNNAKLSSGIYFARLSVDGTVYTKKFIVTE